MSTVKGKQSDREARRSAAILDAVGFAAVRLLRAADWEDEAQGVLARLGEAAEVSRAYVLENSHGEAGELLSWTRSEWAAPGVAALSEHPGVQGFRWVAGGFGRWVAIMERGDPVHGPVKDLPRRERRALASLGVLSLADVPVFAGDEWWGVIGFDDCSTEREWSPVELSALKAAAETLGAAIQRQRGERALREAEARYRTLVEQIPSITYLGRFDEQSTILYVSPQIEAILGHPQRAWIDDPEFWIKRLHPDDRERVLAEAARCLAEQEAFRCEYRTIAADERVVWIREEDMILPDEQGRPAYTQGVMHDITERKRAEEALRESEERFKGVFRDSGVGMALVTPEGRLLQVNPAMCEMLGYSEEELLEQAVPEITHPDDLEADAEQARRLVAGEADSYQLEKRYLHKDGRAVWGLLSVSVVRAEDGTPRYGIGQVQDITERKRSEERIAYLAYHDELTGLPNRAMLQEHLELALARARRHRLGVALLYLDLDRFKLVNDSLGHAAGDEVLRQIARRLRTVTRAEDLTARHSGDEFVLLLADLATAGGGRSALAAEAVAAQIHAALREPFAIQGQEFSVDASIGISLFPADAQEAEALLKHADLAMYASKRTGRGGTQVFARSLVDSATELTTGSRLRRALERGELALHYQPVVDLASGAVEGAEALIRWQDPERGQVLPEQFIPLAEEIGLIEPIGEWALGEVCRQWSSWRDQGLELDLGFNLSLREVRQPDLARRVLAQITAAGADPARIVIEITESAAIADPAHTQRVLRELQAHGLRFAIDDFGVGHSSLTRLVQMPMPVHVLKIDRSFVAGVPGDRVAEAVAAGFINVAHSLGTRSLAEGVETEEQRRFLVEHGCQLAQGFLFSPAVPAAELPALCERGRLGP